VNPASGSVRAAGSRNFLFDGVGFGLFRKQKFMGH
jgi:hypothetical protein